MEGDGAVSGYRQGRTSRAERLVMQRLYRLTARLAHGFFRASRIRVPGVVRRLNRRMGALLAAPPQQRPGPPQQVAVSPQRDLIDELEALNRRVERLETGAYLNGIGRRPDS